MQCGRIAIHQAGEVVRQAAAVRFGFPLHPDGRPGTERAEHLFKVAIPLLFLQGPRDALATPELLQPIVERLGKRATFHLVAGADHSFKVQKSSGRTDADVYLELAKATADWILNEEMG
ncbi:MAG: alpha/beta family hydrolase [Anaerolineales bacterium]